jgi:hypothetical protein
VPNEQDVVSFTPWSTRLAPGLDEITNSNPNAVLLSHNLVAVTSDIDTAQKVALSFERIETTDTSVTSVVYGREKPESGMIHGAPSADPEHVVGHAFKRAMIGGVPGAVIGALVVGLGAFALSREPALLVGGAIGGAFFGFFVAAVWSFVIGTGQSRAYQDSYVDPETADVCIVALHADDAAVIGEAEQEVAGTDGVRLLRVDRRGDSVG